MSRRCSFLVGGALAVSLLAVGPPVAAKTFTFKVATLAPEGSTWWKLFQEAAKDVREVTADRVRIRLYAGGVAGDEVDVVRKMRVGRLHAAAITSVGLSEIQPALLVLQAPGLFESWEELDYVRDQLSDKLAALLAEKGFVTLMWGDVGFNRMFATAPINQPGDLAGTKLWCWTQDGVNQAYYTSLGLNPILAGVPDVLPALQTGRLDAYSTPPLVAVSLQWFVHSKHMLNWPQAVNIGSVLVTEESLANISAEDRAAVFRIGAKFYPRMAEAVRADNQRAIRAIEGAGVRVIEPDAASRAAWATAAAKGADAAAGRIYPADLLAEARRLVAAYREKSAR